MAEECVQRFRLLGAADANEFVKWLDFASDALLPLFKFPEFDNSFKEELSCAMLKVLQQETQLTGDGRLNALTVMRILSRDSSGIDALFSADLCKAVVRYCDDSDSPTNQALEARKCMCNATFHSANVRETFISEGSLEKLCARLAATAKGGDDVPLQPTYFDSRLLFVLTARCAEMRAVCRRDYGALDSLRQILALLAPDERSLDAQRVSLIVEILKAAFNMALDFKHNNLSQADARCCEQLVERCRVLLLCSDAPPDDENCELASHSVNLLAVMPPNALPLLAPQSAAERDTRAVAIVLKLLERQLEKPPREQVEALSPVLTVLAETARSDKALRRHLRMTVSAVSPAEKGARVEVLPPLGADVLRPPEMGDTTRNRLVRLLTSPSSIKDLTAEFLFVLCGRSVERMVKYTGYGNAAGLLANYGLLAGGDAADASDDSADSDTDDYVSMRDKVNPIVGYVDAEAARRADPMAGMSDEQKEYEAMQLVDKINSLMHMGVIKPATVGADGKPKPVEHVLELTKDVESDAADDDSDA